MTFTPDQNDGSHIFVFGSNLAGRHGRGAAKTAFLFWGAIYGQPQGRQGHSYAIPTKDEKLNPLSITGIAKWVLMFKAYAETHRKLTFLVTKIGCGLAGHKEEDMKRLFHEFPTNCILPEGWGKEGTKQ